MKRLSLLSHKFVGLVLIFFLIFNHGVSFSQNISWGKSYGNSTLVAKEQNKLILADFWAIWCVPCLKMDKEAWGNDTISSVANNFVCMRFDISNGWQNAEPFYVDQIPTLKIVDYRGEVLLTKEGYADPLEIRDILASFPEDVSELYQGLQKYGSDDKNPAYLLNLASAYQNCALRSGPPARDIFVKESSKFFKKAKSACKKEKDYSNTERINLLEALNEILSDDFEKGTELVLEQLDKTVEENLSLAYYVLVTGFLGQEKRDLAEEYYTRLKASDPEEEYLKLLRSEFE